MKFVKKIKTLIRILFISLIGFIIALIIVSSLTLSGKIITEYYDIYSTLFINSIQIIIISIVALIKYIVQNEIKKENRDTKFRIFESKE